MSKLLKIELLVPAPREGFDQEALVDDLSAWLSANSLQGWEEFTAPLTREVTLRFYLEPEAPLAATLDRLCAERWPEVELAVESMEQQDWSAAWREFFTPIDIGGRFEILPPWLEGREDSGLEPIIIEPKMAFGTGHHATTALCLEGLAKLCASGRLNEETVFLDLGTGSGILAIGLAKMGCRGFGIDIDPQAVLCAEENLALNRLPASGDPRARLRLGVGGLECLGENARFDVIVANILAQPLIDMAPHLASKLKPGAALVLSGLLTAQAPAVTKAYTNLGMPEPERRDQGEWSALFWV
ncbi:50S ribosomal protein L11 methyltransferase [Fundidesulfovibrio butyratiphilus]